MTAGTKISNSGHRYHGLDTLRGLLLLDMIAYHGCWDMVYLFGRDWGWYRSDFNWFWQQSGCWAFILLSGYCVSLGRRHWKRGWMAFGGGVVVSLVTLLVMPESPAICGILTLMGSAMLLTAALEKLLRRIPARAGLVGSFSLFLLLRDVNDGFLGFEGARILALPEGLYRNVVTAWLGFPPAGFVSSDYFPLLPWVFLFWTGYFLFRLHPGDRKTGRPFPVVTFLGRHSLVVYLLHQAVLFVVLTAIFG